MNPVEKEVAKKMPAKKKDMARKMVKLPVKDYNMKKLPVKDLSKKK